MDQENPKFQREQIEKAIETQNSLRGKLDDSILEITIAALRKLLAELHPDSLVQQRKQVTILFMDIVNSTLLMQELDPEDNLQIMDSALQELAKPVKTRGGKVTRFMGDGFLAVFGLPQARENDPEMAVQAGLGIIETAKKIAKDIEEKYQLGGFQIRVGVNTGLVVAGGETEAEDTIMGAAVNLASRLETAAPPGSILISQHTYHHVRGIFNVMQGEPIRVKGFSEPVQIYQVIEAKPHSLRVLNRGVEGVETPLIGRDQELQVLQKSFRKVIEDQKSQSITVIGEAGIGKSRLMSEFEDWLNDQPIHYFLLKGRATQDSLELPYSLLRNIFIPHFKIQDSDSTPMMRNRIENFFKKILVGDPDYVIHSHYLGQLLGFDFRDSPYLQDMLESPQQLRDQAFTQLIHLIIAMAAENPVVIFLDDIHWADESSLSIINRINAELADTPILFVSFTRNSLFERSPSWGTESNHQQLLLNPLSQNHSKELLEHILQHVPKIPNQLSGLVTKNAEGNPFYLEELIKMLVEDGVIIKGEPTWSVQLDRLPDLGIPSTLTGVIQARLDRLPIAERTILQQASVIGKVFWNTVLDYLNQETQSEPSIPTLKTPDVTEYLNNLQNKGIISKREETTFSGADEFYFKNTIFQEVTYQNVLKRTRLIYHALVANWLINQTGGRIGEISGLIASHLERAEKNAEALNYLCMAAEMATSNYAVTEAADFYKRAISLAPEDDPEKLYPLLMGLNKISRFQGNPDGQRATLTKLDHIVEILGDENKKAELLIQKAWFAFWTSDFPEGLTNAYKSVVHSEKIGDPDLSTQAYYVWAWLLVLDGKIELALEQAETAFSIVQKTDNKRSKGDILNILGLANLSLGNFYTALVHLQGFLSIALEIGDLEREITARNNLGVVLTRLGDYPAARENFQKSYSISQDSGDLSSVSTALINLGWVTVTQGESELALEYCQKGIAKKREHEQLEATAEGLIWLGHALMGLNQPEKAITAYNDSLAIREKLNQPFLIMELRAGLARAALAQKDFATALNQVNQIVSYLDSGESLRNTWEPLRINLTCYQVLEMAEDPRAEKLLENAYNILQEQASKITDQKYRNLFLNNVPWHFEILKIWRARSK